MWNYKPILTKISDIGLTDDELEYNICIKKYPAIGEGGKLIKVNLKQISQWSLVNVVSILMVHNFFQWHAITFNIWLLHD